MWQGPYESYMLTDVTHLAAPRDKLPPLRELETQRKDYAFMNQVVLNSVFRTCEDSTKRWDEKGLELSTNLHVILRDLGPEYFASLYREACSIYGQPVSPLTVDLVKVLLDAGYKDLRYQTLE